MSVSLATDIISAAMGELAEKHKLTVPFDVRVSLTVSNPIVFHLQRDGVGHPRVLVAYDFVCPIFDTELSNRERKEWRAKFQKMALLVLRAAQSLSKRSCLVTGDLAYEMNADRMTLKRVGCLAMDTPLHDRYFTTTVSATIRCAMSGRERIVHATPDTLAHAVHTAKLELSRLLLGDSEDAKLIDLLEAARDGRAEDRISEVIVKEVDWGNQTIIRYEGSPDPITKPLTQEG